ncbi:hypothetical protein [Streptomyces sp. NPDC058291]|uniref:hypothetical protein n=1 Tax=Streptomyces sp. NPDC058291 TaxID=3346427 RepID=UPI0036EDB99C
MTVHPLALARHSGPHADGGTGTGTGTLPAVGLALATTALAAAGYHLVFERTVSCAACLVVALVLLAGALLRSRASGAGALLPDLGAMVSAQAAACCCFSFAASAPSPAGGLLHGGSGGAVHLAMTLVTVCALRAVARSRFRLPARVQAGLCSLFGRLRALLFARTSAAPAADPSRRARAGADDGRRLCQVLLTCAAGRRGPPCPPGP